MGNENAYPTSRWFMLLAVTVGQVMIGMTLICYAPILGIVAKDLAVTVGEISAAAMGVVIFAAAISSIISGPILDRFGVSRSITVGALITAIGVILAPVLDGSLQQIVMVRLLMGLGFGPVSACTSTVAARWFPEQQRGLVAGMVGAGISIGIIFGFIATPALIQHVAHWSSAIGWLAVIPILSFVLSFITIFLPEPKFHETVAADHTATQIKSDAAIAFKSLPTYIGIICMFLFTWMMNAFNDLTPGYIAIPPPTGLGMGPAAAGQYMSAVQVGMLVGSAAVGFILTKIFNSNIKRVIAVGFFFAALFMYSVKFPFVFGNSGLLFAVLFLAGFFEAFIIPMVATFISLNYPSTVMGRVFGTTFGLSLFGGAIGVFVGATFLHITGNYMVSISIVSIVAILGLIVGLFLNPPKAFAHIKG